MKVLVGAFNQEKALVGAFSVIVQPVVEPMEHYTALVILYCDDKNICTSTGRCRTVSLDLFLESSVKSLCR